MCATCSPELIEILNKNTYEEFTAKRDELLDTEELQEEFLDAFNELIYQYANFHESVFHGQFSGHEEVAQERQIEWERHLNDLTQTILVRKNPEPLEEPLPNVTPEAVFRAINDELGIN